MGGPATQKNKIKKNKLLLGNCEEDTQWLPREVPYRTCRRFFLYKSQRRSDLLVFFQNYFIETCAITAFLNECTLQDSHIHN